MTSLKVERHEGYYWRMGNISKEGECHKKELKDKGGGGAGGEDWAHLPTMKYYDDRIAERSFIICICLKFCHVNSSHNSDNFRKRTRYSAVIVLKAYNVSQKQESQNSIFFSRNYVSLDCAIHLMNSQINCIHFWKPCIKTNL